MTAGEKLVRWRLANELSQREAAARVGLSQAAWQSYESGGHPRVRAATAIEKLTKGAVKVGDWADGEEERAVRMARKAARSVQRTKARTTAPRRTGTDG
jgi:transcriptional regulator with XRE-family HTH domain